MCGVGEGCKLEVKVVCFLIIVILDIDLWRIVGGRMKWGNRKDLRRICWFRFILFLG